MKKINQFTYWLLLIVSIIVGVYVGSWLMFVQPIIEACKHFDAGTLTGLMVGTTVLKCFFAGTVCGIVIYTGIAISAFVAAIVEKIITKKNKIISTYIKKGEM